jgi:Protein of unknown function (DUF1592)/Protein of unknown function (DUF1588)/Protein of unknown function (DUF1587)/Protein of unknown function (DUF1585)/Protein of unknown function (DUF1595)/Ca-dependent carbohydrate-binding module xylan-binding
MRFPRSLLIFVALVSISNDARADEAARNASFRDSLLPLLRTYCYECHDADSEIPLEKDASPADLHANRKTWIRALAQVQLGTMPPEDGPKLDAETRQRLAKLIDELANAVDCVRNPNAGKVALRRLNRAEYRNTVRDLTGVDYKPAANFPGDDVGYGFDNIGDVLSLPPLLMEKYLDAAEAISGKAIYTPPAAQIYEINKPPSALIDAEKYGAGSSLTLSSRGTVALECDVPFAGVFKLTITAHGDQGGDEPVKMQIKSGTTDVIVEVPDKQDKEYETSLKLGRGTRKIEISFINDFYEAGKADRNLHIHHVNLRGQERRDTYVDPDKLPPSHKHIIFSTPTEKVTADQASAAVLGRLASRAFRRPATDKEIERLTKLAAQVRTDGGTYEEGIQVALQAVLVSPHFLFRVEQPRQPDASGKMPPISDYELATRISYFLWSSMPDDELLLLAHRGQVRDRKLLLAKVARMLQDPRTNRFVENFAGQWLQLRNLDLVAPDTRVFRSFDNEIPALMERETLMFVAEVMRKNLPVTTLIDADFTFLNEKLAKFYDIPDVTGDEFRRVSLQGTTRGGLLTHASVLTVTSNPTRTSPVKRGKWILDNLLNTPPPPAPPNIPELDKGKLVGTLRERMEQHRADPACASCHNMMDPLGFALENFDAVGRWRTRDGRDEINASGKLPDGTAFNGVAELKQLLSSSRTEQFTRCFAEKMLIYALGRGTEYYDKCAIDKIVAYAAANDVKFAFVVAGIIESDPFQKQGYRE